MKISRDSMAAHRVEQSFATSRRWAGSMARLFVWFGTGNAVTNLDNDAILAGVPCYAGASPENGKLIFLRTPKTIRNARSVPELAPEHLPASSGNERVQW